MEDAHNWAFTNIPAVDSGDTLSIFPLDRTRVANEDYLEPHVLDNTRGVERI